MHLLRGHGSFVSQRHLMYHGKMVELKNDICYACLQCFELYDIYAWVLMLSHVVYLEKSLCRSRHMVSTSFDMSRDVLWVFAMVSCWECVSSHELWSLVYLAKPCMYRYLLMGWHFVKWCINLMLLLCHMLISSYSSCGNAIALCDLPTYISSHL